MKCKDILHFALRTLVWSMDIIYDTVSTAGVLWKDGSVLWIGKEVVVSREIVFVNSTGLQLEVNAGKIKYLLLYRC